MKKILIINGPNLDLLGTREEKIYGEKSFDKIKEELDRIAEGKVSLSYFQSNHEGEIIDKIHECIGNIDFIIINPGALTHYSYSLYDAIVASKIKTIEVHISNISGRERWREKSVISPSAWGVIIGFGPDVYRIALRYVIDYINETKKT
jgi:3-dehydroquinate dehydratase-2